MKKIYFIIAAAALFFAVDANAQIGVGKRLFHDMTSVPEGADVFF